MKEKGKYHRTMKLTQSPLRQAEKKIQNKAAKTKLRRQTMAIY